MIRLVHSLKYKTMGTIKWHHQKKPNNLTIPYYFRFCEMQDMITRNILHNVRKKVFHIAQVYVQTLLIWHLLLFICFLQKRSVLSRTVIILCAVILAVQLFGIGIVLTLYLRGKLYAIFCLNFKYLTIHFLLRNCFSFRSKETD